MLDGNFYPCERVDESANVTKIGNIKSGFDFDQNQGTAKHW